MSSDNQKVANGVQAFADSITQVVSDSVNNVETGLGKKISQIDEKINNFDNQIDEIRKEIGSVKKDVAVGNGQLRTFTIPKKEGEIIFVVGGEKITAKVDEKGNVTGKHVTTSNIGQGQIQVTLDRAIDKDTSVSFVAGNIQEVVKSIEDKIAEMDSMIGTMNQTFISIQKNSKESDDSIKKRLDEFIVQYSASKEKEQKERDLLNQKLDRLHKKLVGVGNILKEEGLSN